ncbi:MAG: asparagine synthase (glutamine-hydrolyzing) [Nitrospirae bacterium]|nr:asparagine synthase (glutamine-hydrolyzing) [Nitrospirota bacterium]
MSGILALWNLDGQPIDRRLLRRLTDVIAHRGPDGAGVWIRGAVALGHRMLYTTPESLREKQPLCDETDNLCLTLDGRVDNRKELRADLEGKGLLLRTDTDAELVLRAYDCWGEDCPKHILGDFAFVIWDGRNRQFFCARDPLGIRPFYYYHDDRLFLCGSALRQILEHPAVRREPNEGIIGEYLADTITSSEETLFRNVVRLPPAHSLTVSRIRMSMTRYWNVDLLRELRYQTNEAYAEQCFDILKEAVLCRLRSQGPVGADLSGGLDSSSVVGMVQTLFREGAAPDPGFETFSLTFPAYECDESPYIKDVVGLWAVKSNALRPAEPTLYAITQEIRRHLGFPAHPNYSMFDSTLALARDKGIRVVLTGLGGDDWLGEGFPPYADLLRQGKWWDLIEEIRKGSSAIGAFSTFKQFLSPLFPQPVHRTYAWAVRRNDVPPWIDSRFARRIHLVERLRKSPAEQPFSSYAQRDVCRAGMGGGLVHSWELVDRSSSSFGIESRHPFADRRFVEFALALPPEQRYKREQVKVVLRHAMRDRLPARVRERSGKADFSHTLALALKAAGSDRLLASSAIEAMGWVDGASVRRLNQQMTQCYEQGDARYIRCAWPLWMAIGIELWYKMVFLSHVTLPETQQPLSAAFAGSVRPAPAVE